MISKIVAPVDFSDKSREALKYAGKLAQHFGATLFVIHVLEPIAYPAEWLSEIVNTQNIEQTLAEQSMKNLQEIIKQEVPPDVNVHSKLLFGYPTDAILQFVKEVQADLICMAPHGHSPLERFLLGSTTEKIIRNAPCPVLVYRN